MFKTATLIHKNCERPLCSCGSTPSFADKYIAASHALATSGACGPETRSPPPFTPATPDTRVPQPSESTESPLSGLGARGSQYSAVINLDNDPQLAAAPHANYEHNCFDRELVKELSNITTLLLGQQHEAPRIKTAEPATKPKSNRHLHNKRRRLYVPKASTSAVFLPRLPATAEAQTPSPARRACPPVNFLHAVPRDVKPRCRRTSVVDQPVKQNRQPTRAGQIIRSPPDRFPPLIAVSIKLAAAYSCSSLRPRCKPLATPTSRKQMRH